MIDHPAFVVEPWAIRESELHLEVLAQTESVFALANGHLGLRGNLDEGEPAGLPGTYLNGFFESHPLPYAEPAYGNPEAGQTVVNATNGKLIRLLVDDEALDIRYGQLLSHQRVLDFRAGTLNRTLEWRTPAGQTVRITSVRLVSFVQRSVAAIRYEVEPLDGSVRLVVRSELAANEPVPTVSDDPRTAAALEAPLVLDLGVANGTRVVLVHATRASGLRMAAAMDHVVEGPPNTEVADAETVQDFANVTIAADAEVGQRLTVVKLLAYGWSAHRSSMAVADQVSGALAEARHTGWQGLLDAQREYLDEFWQRADVEIEGDSELQQAVRFAIFHTLQAGARGERRAIPAKGLTGPGYDGHAFWDTETYVLPLLTYTEPRAAGDALRWRHSTLDLARERAQQLGLKGAAFPWRTIRGEECSGYWPAGTAAFHIGADIAAAVLRYQTVTGDEAFAREVGIELLVETARLWRSLGHHDAQGRFRIDGVTGPDEYSALADNNVYTNLMAQRNLEGAATAVQRFPDRAAELEVDLEEAAGWRDAARSMFIPYDEALGVHPQAEEFTEHQVWDFAHTQPDQYPLLLHFPYFDLYRKQVVKQADLVMALAVRGDAFTDEQKARNFDYYEALTVRDSSLSASVQAVIAAEVGHIELAYDYVGEAAMIDLHDLEHNTRDGLHIASLAGAWIATVGGFGGVRDHDGTLSFIPRLPEWLNRLTYRLGIGDALLKVEVERRQARYQLLQGTELEVHHYGERLKVTSARRMSRRIPELPQREPPSQPPGRAPLRRRPSAEGTPSSRPARRSGRTHSNSQTRVR